VAITLTPEMHNKRLDQLIGLSDTDVAERRSYIGGSDANTICGNLSPSISKERILNLYLEKIGEKEPDDLSDILAVQMGTWTEDLNLYWFEKQTGYKVTERNVQKSHPDHPWIRARADGEIDELDAVLDAKHVSAFNFDMDVLMERYAPQLVVQALCCGRSRAFLSVFSGSNRWEYAEVEITAEMVSKVVAQLSAFWKCVQDKVPPVKIEPLPALVPYEDQRKIDMSKSNEWIYHERGFLNTEQAAKDNKEEVAALKDLVPSDVREAAGDNIIIRRSKNGSLRISKVKK